MKTQKAQLKYLNVTPRKVRLLASTLRGLSTQEAEAQLLLRPHRAATPLLKLLRSAVANAKNNELNTANLVVSEILVSGGPTLKRYLPRAQGRASLLLKRTSHISLTLSEKESAPKARFTITPKEKKAKKSAEKPKATRSTGSGQEKKEAIKKETPRPTESKEKIKDAKPGTLRKMFQRKSV